MIIANEDRNAEFRHENRDYDNVMVKALPETEER